MQETEGLLNPFRFKTPHGYILISVNNYFYKAHWRDINKLLNIAKKWNTEQNRTDFIEKLKNAKQYWEENHSKLFRTTEKQLIALLIKFQKVIDKVAADKWGEKG